uniref:RRM domain-containing protein n=1 Tax=Bionectria ochroleuca TaxID=29856 RepID=A0A8H7N9G6_BIOOC
MNGDSYSRDSRRGRDYPGGREDRDDRRERHRDRDRRRSRSPDHRSNRRAEGDVDAYSSSRNHRDREREDRYSGRDRRRDREWDRDRGSSRRDARRDDEDRYNRRDRDNYDDRRRGGRERREEAPLEMRAVRRLTQWDIKPPGYDFVTAEQAKLSGMFPLPGAPRQQPVDPTKLQAFNQPGGQVTEEELIAFFNLQLNGLNVIETPDPCAQCQFSGDGSLAILEFKNSQDTTVALAFDGVSMHADDTNGSGGSANGLQIRRPKDFSMPAFTEDLRTDLDVVSNVVPDSINKLSITNLPTFLNEEQVMELLVAFGKPKAFVLVKDRSTEQSSGIAFVEFADPLTANNPALETLNACIGPTQMANFDVGIAAISGLASQTNNAAEQSRVLQLLNMVTPEELLDNDEYEEISDDVREECSKFGNIVAIKIPRPSGGSRQSAGVGKIFIKYDEPDTTAKALKALAGRKFADRTVVATYFPEENFDVGAW